MATLVLIASLVGLSAWAQQVGKPPAGDLVRAKEMAALIEQGQLSLRIAAEMAEKHVKGTALEARCDMQSGSSESAERERSGNPSAEKDRPPEKRLVYTVSCFANDKIQTVRVDGLTKKVIEEPQRPQPDAGSKP
jgi:hypothetical protein